MAIDVIIVKHQLPQTIVGIQVMMQKVSIVNRKVFAHSYFHKLLIKVYNVNRHFSSSFFFFFQKYSQISISRTLNTNISNYPFVSKITV